MRERTRLRNETYASQLISWVGNGSPQTIFNRNVTTSYGETMHDTETPNFTQRVRKGLPLSVNPMMKWDTVVTANFHGKHSMRCQFGRHNVSERLDYHGSFALLNRAHSESGAHALTNGVTPKTLISGHERRSVLMEALAAANTEAMDVGTFVAEFNKTLSMINALADRLLQRANVVEDRRRKQSRRRTVGSTAAEAVWHARSFAQSWLEYRYGWRILYYEMRDIQRMLRRLGEGQPKFIRQTRTLSRTDSQGTQVFPPGQPLTPNSFRSGDGVSLYAGSATRSMLRITTEFEQRVRGFVGVEPDFRRLGFFDPLVTISEVIPYHLVLNWLFTTKAAVEAFSPFVTAKLRWSGITVINTKRAILTRSYTDELDVTSGPRHARFKVLDPCVDVATVETVFSQRSALEPTLAVRPRWNLRGLRIADFLAIFGPKLLGLRTFVRKGR